ncbi:MAG TPA: DUF3618 domain-containing protein [Allosphingosinicella sp.]|nr:DUF3618 domain-containing protein [Allosphingosinicella sp.]
MSLAEISIARQEAERARRRLAATAAELQQRLKPGTLASNAWEGVKDKSGEMADGAVEAVKSRPVPVAAALAAFTLFLARAPLRAAVSRLWASGDEADEDLVAVRLDGGDKDYDLTAPLAAGTSEGAGK